jgi:hypothetical protein
LALAARKVGAEEGPIATATTKKAEPTAVPSKKKRRFERERTREIQ